MFKPLHGLRHWRRAIATWHIIASSDCCRSEAIKLWYPKIAWYQENAAAMLRILDEAAVELERRLGLALPKPTCCFVVEPERAADLLGGAMGIACADLAFVAPPERHLSDLGRVAAHELAHVLAHGLGGHPPPFLAEGFACYGAWLIEADKMPMGIPLHYHLVGCCRWGSSRAWRNSGDERITARSSMIWRGASLSSSRSALAEIDTSISIDRTREVCAIG